MGTTSTKAPNLVLRKAGSPAAGRAGGGPGASLAHMKSIQPAAARAKQIAVKAQCMTLLGVLRDPPADYDGTNAKLASYMGVSVRTVIRCLNRLIDDGHLERSVQTLKTPEGFFRTRFLEIKEK